MDSRPAGNTRKMYKMLDSQTALLWSQVFTLEPKKVKLSNILGFYIKVSGGDAQALERAYNKVIETNDSLRLRFCRTGVLKIRQFIDDFSYVVLPRKKVADRLAFDEYLGQISRTILPMFGDRLTWAELVTIDDEGTVLVMRFHHLVMDGYSISLIFSRIIEAYDQYMQGTDPEPKPYSIQKSFEQFNEYKTSKRHAEDREFWRKSFNTQPHYSFPAGKRAHKGECAIKQISIENQLYQDVITLAAGLCCSVQCLIMSAAAFTVYKLTAQTNFCITSMTHGRYDAAAKKTIGCLMNTVPVFFNMDPNKTVQVLIQEEYMNFLETLKHGRLSLTEHTPLSYKEPVLHGFNFNHSWLLVSVMEYGDAFSKSSYEAQMIPAANQPFQFYGMVLEVPGSKIDIRLRYQTRKFTSDQITCYLQTFYEVMRLLTINPDVQLSSIRNTIVPCSSTVDP